MRRPRVMLHTIMPNQISGPNSAARRIKNSRLSERYEFGEVTQTFHAGGTISVALIRDLRAQIKAFDPHLIHLSGLQSSGFHAAIAARLAARVPILVTIRGFSGDALDLPTFRRVAFNFAVEPLTLSLSTRFTTVTRDASRRRMVRTFGWKYAGAIHNAAPAWRLERLGEVALREARARLGLPAGFVVTVIGRMVTDKGIPTVLDVARMLPEGFSVCLVGDGPWFETVQSDHQDLLLNARVVLLGQRDDVRSILQVSDAFLFATLHENLSNALLEAMAASLPTVATNVGGNPEVVLDGETGFLVSPGDAETMTDRLVALRDDAALRRRLADNGRRRAETAFSPERIYGRLANLYDSLLRTRGDRTFRR